MPTGWSPSGCFLVKISVVFLEFRLHIIDLQGDRFAGKRLREILLITTKSSIRQCFAIFRAGEYI